MASKACLVLFFSAAFLVVLTTGKRHDSHGSHDKDYHGHQGRHHDSHERKSLDQCYDARKFPPPADLDLDKDDRRHSSSQEEEDVYVRNADGTLTGYCGAGCCHSRKHRVTHCCGGDDDEKHHHKALAILAVVAGVMTLGMIALIVCVCVLKKKARRAARVYHTTGANFPVVITDSGKEKKPLPEADVDYTGILPDNYKDLYVIQGVAPPAYNVVPAGTPRITPDAPPTYSTISLQRAVRESEASVAPIGKV